MDEPMRQQLRVQMDDLASRVAVVHGLTLLDGLAETASAPADDATFLRALEEADAAVAAAERVRSTLAGLSAEQGIAMRAMASRVRATHATVGVWIKRARAFRDVNDSRDETAKAG